MVLTRRTALAAGGVTIVGLGFGLVRADLLRRDLEDAIETSFSPEIAKHPETARFLDDLLGWVQGLNNASENATLAQAQSNIAFLKQASSDKAEFANFTVKLFAQSTNAVRVMEAKQELAYQALWNPYDSVCGNQLTANWL